MNLEIGGAYYILYIFCFQACIYPLTLILENQKKKILKRIAP